MKRIAFYVEGVTEQFFLNKLLIEIAGKKEIAIELQQFKGADASHKTEIYPKTRSEGNEPKYNALILDCAGDGNVKSRIIDDCDKLFSKGYSKVIGLLDLYPRSNLVEFENSLKNGTIHKGKQLTKALPSNTEIIVAVQELEAWFLSEHTHFLTINPSLTNTLIYENLKFNPSIDDMTLRLHPAEDLHKIYQLVGYSYLGKSGRKRKHQIEITIECLDYSVIYVDLANKIEKLKQLIFTIDSFLT